VALYGASPSSFKLNPGSADIVLSVSRKEFVRGEIDPRSPGRLVRHLIALSFPPSLDLSIALHGGSISFEYDPPDVLAQVIAPSGYLPLSSVPLTTFSFFPS